MVEIGLLGALRAPTGPYVHPVWFGWLLACKVGAGMLLGPKVNLVDLEKKLKLWKRSFIIIFHTHIYIYIVYIHTYMNQQIYIYIHMYHTHFTMCFFRFGSEKITGMLQLPRRSQVISEVAEMLNQLASFPGAPKGSKRNSLGSGDIMMCPCIWIHIYI